MLILLRTMEENDLRPIWEIAYDERNADLAWRKLDDPYLDNPLFSWEEFSKGYGQTLINNANINLIILDAEVIGIVTAYWSDGKLKYGPNQWLEVGIAIFNQNYWDKGVGSEALRLWIKKLFNQYDYLPHIGFTTWSGNIGMQKVGEKIGMTKEGVIRQVRYFKDQYYDAVKYGILRNELK